MKKLLTIAFLITLVSCGQCDRRGRSNRSGGQRIQAQIGITASNYSYCSSISVQTRCTDYASSQFLTSQYFYSGYCYSEYLYCVNSLERRR